MKLWIIGIVVFFFTSCSTVCKIDETRCNANVAEVCDANGQWQRIIACDQVEGGDEPWKCCAASTDGGLVHACLPATSCIGGDL